MTQKGDLSITFVLKRFFQKGLQLLSIQINYPGPAMERYGGAALESYGLLFEC